MRLFVVVRRVAISLHYKRIPSAPASFGNNDANNSHDSFEVYENHEAGHGALGTPLMRCRAQTVSNCEGLVEGMRFSHTIAPGPFELCAFVEPRDFYGRIHGIRNTHTLGGDIIGAYSVIMGNKDRWLVHDWQFKRPKPPGQDTRVAWSGGCLVIPDRDLWSLGQLFDSSGIYPGDVISGLLFQEV
jgi:hypothetical protein